MTIIDGITVNGTAKADRLVLRRCVMRSRAMYTYVHDDLWRSCCSIVYYKLLRNYWKYRRIIQQQHAKQFHHLALHLHHLVAYCALNSDSQGTGAPRNCADRSIAALSPWAYHSVVDGFDSAPVIRSSSSALS